MKKLIALVVGLFAAPVAMAGTTGTEFQVLFETLDAWISGYLGKSIAVASFIIGAGIGAAKMSAIPALIGVVIALFISIFPTIINGIVSGVIPV